MQFLFAALVFLSVMIVLFGAIYAFTGQEKEAEIIRGRLEAIEKGTSFVKDVLKLDLIRDELFSSIPTINKVLKGWAWPTRLRSFTAQAGMQLRPGKLMLISAVVGLTALEVTNIIYATFALSVAAGVIAALLPLAFVAIKRARRMAAFQRQFPEVIDLLSRSVRAGHSFGSGMEIVATDLPDPVSTEFRITFDEQRFGLPLRDALLNLSARVPLVDVRLFVIALLVQKETGGNLVEILGNLAHVIRERFKIAGDVRVRTAQGRLTAGVLIALPLAMLIMLHLVNPDYIKVLFVEHVGKLMLLGAFILQAIGAIVIWRIVTIKV